MPEPSPRAFLLMPFAPASQSGVALVPAGPPSMTVGPVGATLLRLTLPMLGALLATIGCSVAGTWFIARLGPHALAAVSFTFLVSGAIVTALLAAYGTKAVAGSGVAGRIESLAMIAFLALSAVMNPFAGQNFGAARLDRVRAAMRGSFAFCLGLGAVLAVVLWLAGPRIAGTFTGDAEVAGVIAAYLAIVPVSYGAAGIIAVANSAFNGLERPGAAVLISAARTMLVNVPVAWLGRVFLGVRAANLLVGAWAASWIWRATAPGRQRLA